MLLKIKNNIFFLVSGLLLLFITGCGRFGAYNAEKPASLPSPTASLSPGDTAGSEDPFLQGLPVNKAPGEYVTEAYMNKAPRSGVENLTSKVRKAILPPSLVVKTLKIKPGMEILDLGSGTGVFTFPMADKLNNTGRVYATEVDPKLIKAMQDYISNNKYKNVTPVLVKGDGVDSFYKKHQFDVILVCETLPCLRDITAYFRELRPSLKKAGRLFIINFRNVSDFDDVDFDDYKETVTILRDRGEKFPVFKRLDKEVQDYIKNLPADKISSPPAEIKTRILRDFNKMLPDRLLLDDFIDYFDYMGYYKQEKYALPEELEWARPFCVIINPAELSLFKWLFAHLDDQGVFDRDSKITLTSRQKRKLRKFNKMILSGIFHLYKTSIVKGEFHLPVFLSKKRIIYKMEKAGYKLVNDYNLLSQYYFLEFKRKY